MRQVDLIIIGGGAAGLSAAIKASESNQSIVLMESSNELGGILNQCIHSGFGLKHFKEDLTGPEYAHRLIETFLATDVEVMMHTTVTTIYNDKTLDYINSSGAQRIGFKAIVLTTGSMERNRFDIGLNAPRIQGIYTAGLAQEYMNRLGHLVGKNIVIVGSGDIGLIMARRMRLEGANVMGVVEINPYTSGLNRNVAQCLEDFDIPLFLSTVVVRCEGKDRLEKVIIQRHDKGNLIEGTEQTFKCDTLLLSVGLIPENRLTRGLNISLHPDNNRILINEYYQSSVDFLFVCGNALHIHDLVDDVSKESALAGLYASQFIASSLEACEITTQPGEMIHYVLPNKVSRKKGLKQLYFRVKAPLQDVTLSVKQGDKIIFQTRKKILLPSMMEHIRFDYAIDNELYPLTLEVTSCTKI